jgi:hypothetical protein
MASHEKSEFKPSIAAKQDECEVLFSFLLPSDAQHRNSWDLLLHDIMGFVNRSCLVCGMCPLPFLLLSVATTVARELLMYSRTTLLQTPVIWIGLALGRKYVENSTQVTCLEITSYRIKSSTVYFCNFESGVVARFRSRYIL